MKNFFLRIRRRINTFLHPNNIAKNIPIKAASSIKLINNTQKKVTIYTIADKRPEFLPLQVVTFKKHIKDKYEFIVLNNAIDSPERSQTITDLCAQLGIHCINVQRDQRYSIIGNQETFCGSSYTNPNVACAYPIKWGWERMCEENKDKLFVLIDSDMFIYKDISFNTMLEGYDAAFVMTYRGLQRDRAKAKVTYMWNAICIFHPEKISHLNELNWDCGVTPDGYIHRNPVDVGGYTHFWLKKYPIKVRHISEYGIYKYQQKNTNAIALECTLNGNYHFAFDYDITTKKASGFHAFEKNWKPGKRILPHFPVDYEERLVKKSIRYFEKFTYHHQIYPQPTLFGFIEFDNFTGDPDPAILHIKGGSNYHGFTEEYFQQKTQFVKNTLNIT